MQAFLQAGLVDESTVSIAPVVDQAAGPDCDAS
jgi:riboflavin biosynthesis pyrimidine reductase